MSICLGMICKNESKAIRRCLKSVRDHIDYWVICDTGSTDDTKDIIYDCLDGIPGQLLDHKWENFGANRTRMMEVAKGKSDWLIMLDADFEVLGDFEGLEDKNTDALRVRFEGDFSWRLPLITNNRMSFYYEGGVHEHLACVEAFDMEDYNGISLIHHGQDSACAETRLERNLELLLEEPASPRKSFYLGETYRQLGDTENALVWYAQRIQDGGWVDETFYAKWKTGELLQDKGLLFEAWSFLPSRVESLNTLQWIYRLEGRWDMCRWIGEIAVQIPQPEGLFVHGEVYRYYAPYELALTYHALGETEKASEIVRSLVSMDCPANIMEAFAQHGMLG